MCGPIEPHHRERFAIAMKTSHVGTSSTAFKNKIDGGEERT